MLSPWLGEFLGTLVLILMGDGVVAGVLLKKSKAENSGWIVITAGWALAVMCGVFTALACGSPGAFLNPAVALAFAIHSGDFSQLLSLVSAEMSGAIAGAALVWLHYLPHWKETPDQAAKLGIFCTGPAIRDYPANFLSEVIATFVLVFVAFAIFSRHVSPGGTTGYAINPARDLGPRIAHAILPIAGKGSSGWDYAAIPAFGPLVGGA